jgi:hypothetical protein
MGMGARALWPWTKRCDQKYLVQTGGPHEKALMIYARHLSGTLEETTFGMVPQMNGFVELLFP